MSTAKRRAKPTTRTATVTEPAAKTTIVCVKGFNADWTCTPNGGAVEFQYEFGKTYEHNGPVRRCGEGFHACPEHPLDVFLYYPPAGSRYAEVKLGGEIARDANDLTKIAAAKITIGVEISIGELVKRAWDYVWSRCKIEEGGHATGDLGAASATGDLGAASATGDQGAASATGYQGAASATGYQGAASATGYQGAAMAIGYDGRAKGADGNALFLAERDADLNIISVWAGIVGRDGIRADVWYMCRDGKPVEVAR